MSRPALSTSGGNDVILLSILHIFVDSHKIGVFFPVSFFLKLEGTFHALSQCCHQPTSSRFCFVVK